ncbi:MAG TPA: phage tail protein [Acidimicrobiales bacterium]
MPAPTTSSPPDIAAVVLEADGQELARFNELVAITSEVDLVELREGTEPDQPHRLPGRGRPPSVVLRRPFTVDTTLATWHEGVRTGDHHAARRNAGLVLYEAAGRPVARFELEHAWPTKLEVAARADDPGILSETVALTCDALRRVPV